MLGEKFSPCVLAGVEDGGVIGEHPVAEIGFSQILPDVFGRVEFGTSGRQRHKGEVAGWIELSRGVPPGRVEDEQRMGPRRDGAADRVEMSLHGLTSTHITTKLSPSFGPRKRSVNAGSKVAVS